MTHTLLTCFDLTNSYPEPKVEPGKWKRLARVKWNRKPGSRNGCVRFFEMVFLYRKKSTKPEMKDPHQITHFHGGSCKFKRKKLRRPSGFVLTRHVGWLFLYTKKEAPSLKRRSHWQHADPGAGSTGLKPNSGGSERGLKPN